MQEQLERLNKASDAAAALIVEKEKLWQPIGLTVWAKSTGRSLELGLCRVDGKFRIAVRQGTEWCVPWIDCSRPEKIDSFFLLPSLNEKIMQELDSLAKKADSNLRYVIDTLK